MEPKGMSPYYGGMACEVELIFRDRDALLRGKFKVERNQLIVTAHDGRQKIAPLGGNDADAVARSMIREMEAQRHSPRLSDSLS